MKIVLKSLLPAAPSLSAPAARPNHRRLQSASGRDHRQPTRPCADPPAQPSLPSPIPRRRSLLLSRQASPQPNPAPITRTAAFCIRHIRPLQRRHTSSAQVPVRDPDAEIVTSLPTPQQRDDVDAGVVTSVPSNPNESPPCPAPTPASRDLVDRQHARRHPVHRRGHNSLGG